MRSYDLRRQIAKHTMRTVKKIAKRAPKVDYTNSVQDYMLQLDKRADT